MGLFSKHTILGKITRKVGNAAKKVVKTVAKAAPVVGGIVGSIVPGVGTAIGAAAGGLVSKIAKGVEKVKQVIPEEVANSVVNAVARDGEVKVDKVESTIQTYMPSITESQLRAATTTAVQGLQEAVPTASINDKASLTNISFLDKAKAFITKYLYWILGGLGAFIAGYIFLNNRGGRRRRF